jgi:hypothetical protein
MVIPSETRDLDFSLLTEIGIQRLLPVMGAQSSLTPTDGVASAANMIWSGTALNSASLSSANRGPSATLLRIGQLVSEIAP